MRLGNLLFSVVHLFVVVFVFGVGALFIGIPYSPSFGNLVSESISGQSNMFTLLGGGFLLLGFILLVSFYAMHRRRYLTIEMNYNRARIDESIVKDYIADYWSNQFKRKVSDVVFHSNQKLEVIADLPDIEEETLKRVEDELSVLLARKLGYERDFQLTVVES